MIYLDNNATTRLMPEVVAELVRVWENGPLNPSSQHAAGRLARTTLDRAAGEIGRLLGAEVGLPGGAQLIFTSGGTESNNLAFHGIVDSAAPRLISRIEHPSILEVAKAYPFRETVAWLPVDRNGVAQIEALENWLRTHANRDTPPLVCLMAANNETGVLQPIAAASKCCREHRAHLHVDATQWVGKLPLDFQKLQISSLTFAAHKFHGPVGIGGLLLAPGVTLRAQWQGGAQQLGMRPGTEAVPLAAGAALALRLAHDRMDANTLQIAALRDKLERGITEALPDVIVHGGNAKRLPTTSCLGFPGVDRQSMLMSLDMAGIACSSGSACASGSSEPSYVLQAMAVSPTVIDGSLRFGLSKFSTDSEISEAIHCICSVYKRLRTLSSVEK